MIILGIETSCDETAISIIEAEGKPGQNFKIKILANEVLSQIALHREYGGVFPSLAKREHSKNLVPLLLQALNHSKVLENFGMKKAGIKINLDSQFPIPDSIDKNREPELWRQFFEEIPKIGKPPIDLVAVTEGPGLEPALWVGINFAKVLSAVWEIPLMPINHMEGHIFASLLRKDAQISNSPNYLISKKIPNSKTQAPNPDSSKAKSYTLSAIIFPALALLVSGGHTELVLIKNWFDYEVIGETRDDAVGEAFDKVARILGLPYPGGPEISKLAKDWRASEKKGLGLIFPRPMINSPDLDFSFSGLKTSVLYAVQKLPKMTPDIKAEIATAFEDAAVQVLVEKTKKAIQKSGAKLLILGGGVAANDLLREHLLAAAETFDLKLAVPEISHATDNALMIAVAAAARTLSRKKRNVYGEKIVAKGNLDLSS